MAAVEHAQPDLAASRRLSVVRRYITEHVVAVSAAGLVLACAAFTGTLWGDDGSLWGVGPVAVFSQGRWWTPLTAIFVPDSAVDTILTILLALTGFAYAERLLGRLRLLGVTLVVALAGNLVATAVHALLWTVSDLRPVEAAETPVLDPATAMVGALMAASALASALWRRRIRVVGFAVLAMFALYAGDTDAWYRLVAAVLGLLVGLWLVRGTPRRSWHRSSTRETRSITALVVAVTGLGPLAAVLAGGGRGPLSFAVSFFTQYDENLVDLCATRYSPLCDHQLAVVVTRGVGPGLMALVPVALLLVAALGLRRGRRSALVLAVVVEALIGVLAIWSVIAGTVSVGPWGDPTWLEYGLWAVAAIGVSLAMACALVVLRRFFPVRADRRAVLWFTGTVSATLAACAATHLVAESIFRQTYVQRVSVTDLLVETLRRFVPPSFLRNLGQPPYPTHGAALLIYQWVGVLFWAVFIVAMLRMYRFPQHAVVADHERYRRLLRRGGGTLGFMGTWRGNDHWYTADGTGAVAFRRVGDVALAIADPLCVPGQRDQTVRAFVDHCADQGWSPAFYSIHDEYLPIFRDMGWAYTSVGEETVMVLAELTLTGKAWQKVRQPMTRAERDGFVALWTRWDDLTADQIAQIREIDEQWVADKALPELGFTLGSIEEAKDPDVALVLAVDPEERIQVVTSWMPSWRSGRRVGWTLDYMRRRVDGPNGLMEFVIVKTALRAKDDGLEVVSLSGAPLASKPGGAAESDRTLLASLLEQVAGALEPAYGFASLFRFKSKFRPEYRTLYLAYSDPVELPSIGMAVLRAYLSEPSARELVAVARAGYGGAR